MCPKRGSSILQAYEQYREKADSKVCCDYALHVIVPHFDEKVKSEMGVLTKEKGVNSFKSFLAYPEIFMLEDDQLYDFFVSCRELGAIAQVHAENGKLIARRQEEIAKKGILGPEGHAYSRPEQVIDHLPIFFFVYFLGNILKTYFSVKSKLRVVRSRLPTRPTARSMLSTL